MLSLLIVSPTVIVSIIKGTQLYLEICAEMDIPEHLG